MNRRQEVAAWVFGLLMAAPILGEALTGSNWFAEVGQALPGLLIIMPLAIFSLRTRGAATSSSVVVVGAVMLAGAVALVQARLADMELAVEAVSTKVEDASVDSDRRLDEVEQALSKVSDRLDDIAYQAAR